MAKCKVCGKRFAWIQIPDEGSPTGLAWKKFERPVRGEPRRPHECVVKKVVKPEPLDERRPRPWWLNDD